MRRNGWPRRRDDRCSWHKPIPSRVRSAAAKSLQSCPTMCDPLDGSPPGSPVPGILQARILEWVTIAFSRTSSQPRDPTWVSCTADRFFTIWTTREALYDILEQSKNDVRKIKIIVASGGKNWLNRSRGIFWSDGGVLHRERGLGYTGGCICQNPLSNAIWVCAFHCM